MAAVDLTIRLNEARQALEQATHTCQQQMDEDALQALEAARSAESAAQAAWIEFGRQASAGRLRGQARDSPWSRRRKPNGRKKIRKTAATHRLAKSRRQPYGA
ncbi:hypothetical protein [Hankyongella ginsenosidimutans]|uniref:hypothetical protein n=1 Tax=Hankyongella ginsenosidimutans TaxID=1763828 RepID=UPI001CA35614|nr:hypothetical protein [Hankyongella ginsenosidimutans]